MTKDLKVHGIEFCLEHCRIAKRLQKSWLILKTKQDFHGKLEHHKERIVAKGFIQKGGVNYNETFSLVL